MNRNSERDIIQEELSSWGERRRAVEAERDPLVQRALAAGFTIEEIARRTWLARTTIDRIGKTKEG